jgi:hypothetical protein
VVLLSRDDRFDELAALAAAGDDYAGRRLAFRLTLQSRFEEALVFVKPQAETDPPDNWSVGCVNDCLAGLDRLDELQDRAARATRTPNYHSWPSRDASMRSVPEMTMARDWARHTYCRASSTTVSSTTPSHSCVSTSLTTSIVEATSARPNNSRSCSPRTTKMTISLMKRSPGTRTRHLRWHAV